MGQIIMRDDITTIIFDLDGTLANTLPDITAAVKYAMNVVGCPIQSDDEVKACIGGGAKNLIKRTLGEEHKQLFDEALAVFADYYSKHVVDETRLYPDVISVLDHYYGKKHIALATFKARQGTMEILEHFDIRRYFDVVVTVDDVEKPKPDPECLMKVLSVLRAAPGEAVYVGDTITDIKTGKNAGVITCAVTYGFGTTEEVLSQKPDFTISSLKQIKKIF